MGNKRKIAVIVAHPDDETLWCGGEILTHREDDWFIACLCRKNDRERATKFKKGYSAYQASGAMAALDDGPEQIPLPIRIVENAVLEILPKKSYDLIITHSPRGEYTRHLRHEEVGRAVINMWNEGKINCKELRLFAYEDGGRGTYPQAIEHADIYQELPRHIWDEKYRFITDIYGFDKTSWEAKTTPKKEAFWQFEDPETAMRWL